MKIGKPIAGRGENMKKRPKRTKKVEPDYLKKAEKRIEKEMAFETGSQRMGSWVLDQQQRKRRLHPLPPLVPIEPSEEENRELPTVPSLMELPNLRRRKRVADHDEDEESLSAIPKIEPFGTHEAQDQFVEFVEWMQPVAAALRFVPNWPDD